MIHLSNKIIDHNGEISGLIYIYICGMEACSSRELVKRNVFPSSIFQLSYLMLNAKIRHFHKHLRASMPRTSLKRQHSESRYVHSKFLTSVEGTKRLSMGKRTTFSRNNSSFLDYHLNLEEKGKRLEDSVEDCARVKWCPWFVSKRILFLLLCFPASRIGCATALFQYEKKWNGFSFSLSLVERDDNSTCVNSFQSKKNKRKAKKREDRESISRVKSSEVYEGGGKKNIFRVIARDCFLSSSKPHPCETILSNRIESKLRNKCCETSWLFETLSTSGNWSWRARDFFADECKIWPIEQMSSRMTKILSILSPHDFSCQVLLLRSKYYYAIVKLSRGINSHSNKLAKILSIRTFTYSRFSFFVLPGRINRFSSVGNLKLIAVSN